MFEAEEERSGVTKPNTKFTVTFRGRVMTLKGEYESEREAVSAQHPVKS